MTQKILPAKPHDAIKAMIAITNELNQMMIKEEKALATQDSISLVILESDKEEKSVQYARAATEFRERMEEFRGIDDLLLNQLEQTQMALGTRAKNNMQQLANLKSRLELIEGNPNVAANNN